MDIAIVVFKNTLKSACFAIEELFQVNNLYTKQKDEVKINIHFVSTQKIDFLDSKSISKKDTYDIVLIPPIMSQNDFSWINEELNSWLINMYYKGAILTSACVGSFYLANTKLLNGKKATTHWAYSDLFKKSFPKVDLDTDKILIDEGSIITAGGVTAYTDLCLYLIEKFHSNKTATSIANLFVVDKKGIKTFQPFF